jgi:hypothetical protein
LDPAEEVNIYRANGTPIRYKLFRLTGLPKDTNIT